MEHAARPYPEQLFPWRTAALAAGALAVVEFVFLVILGAGALVPSGHSAAATRQAAPVSHARARKQAAPPPHRLLTRAQTSVLVLNGNGLAGAAASESQRVRGAGYVVRGVGNAAQMAGGPTVVMYAPRFRTEGQRLARDLGVSVVAPLDGLRVSGLRGAQVVIVVGD